MAKKGPKPLKRSAGGQFAPGNRGGPGRRPKPSPLHKAVSETACVELWKAELEAAKAGNEDARRFVLLHKSGRPTAATPNVPSLPWPEIKGPEDLPEAVRCVFESHAAGKIDSAGMGFLFDQLVKAAKVCETADLQRRIKAIEEALEAEAA